MQRQNRIPFIKMPERTLMDADDIELVNMADIDPVSDRAEDTNEARSPTPTHCYAVEYAITPFLAVADAVRESIDDADINNNPQTLCDHATNATEYMQATISAPIAYGSAALVSVVGFFSGTARDIYETAANYFTHDTDNINTP